MPLAMLILGIVAWTGMIGVGAAGEQNHKRKLAEKELARVKAMCSVDAQTPGNVGTNAK